MVLHVTTCQWKKNNGFTCYHLPVEKNNGVTCYHLPVEKKREGHDGPVSPHWLIHEIPSYQALQYLGIGLKHRPLTKTKNGSHSSYVKHQEDFKRLLHMKPCKTCNPWQSI